MLNATQAVAEFVVATNLRSFPEEAVPLCKRLFMDCIGVTLTAAAEPVVGRLTQLLESQAGAAEALIWGKRMYLPLASAVLLNGTGAHALDFDDTAFSHPSAVLLPVAVAMGEKLRLSGEEVMGGLLIGYEVFGSLSLCSDQKKLRARGWHPTPILGTLAAAATAAKLLRLKANEVVMALGIAASMASGLGQNFGTMVKPLHAGFSARNGLFAAQLAAQGVQADGHILETPKGFGFTFFGKDGHGIDRIGQVLGSPYKALDPGINIKPYPCCRSTHRAIDAALFLQRHLGELRVDVGRIEQIECDLNLDGPTFYHFPRNGLEGKFSIAYCLSAALCEGRVGLETFADSKIADPKIEAMMRKIKDVRFPGEDEIVKIRLDDGREFMHTVSKAKGDALTNPLSDEELQAKFEACAQAILTAEKIRDAIQAISRLEQVADFREFMPRVFGI